MNFRNYAKYLLWFNNTLKVIWYFPLFNKLNVNVRLGILLQERARLLNEFAVRFWKIFEESLDPDETPRQTCHELFLHQRRIWTTTDITTMLHFLALSCSVKNTAKDVAFNPGGGGTLLTFCNICYKVASLLAWEEMSEIFSLCWKTWKQFKTTSCSHWQTCWGES